jgi:hypothetical protein
MEPLELNSQQTRAAAAQFTDIGIDANSIGNRIHEDINGQGDWFAGDSYDASFGPMLDITKNALEFFPALASGANLVRGNVEDTVSGYGTTDDINTELAAGSLGPVAE